MSQFDDEIDAALSPELDEDFEHLLDFIDEKIYEYRDTNILSPHDESLKLDDNTSSLLFKLVDDGVTDANKLHLILCEYMIEHGDVLKRIFSKIREGEH